MKSDRLLIFFSLAFFVTLLPSIYDSMLLANGGESKYGGCLPRPALPCPAPPPLPRSPISLHHLIIALGLVQDLDQLLQSLEAPKE